MRLILWPLALIYLVITELRNALFKWGILKSVSFDVPVISVGNLSVGGTGKTPMTKYLIKHLSNHYTIGVLSRGYGRKTSGFKVVEKTSRANDVGDEPLEIKLHYPDTTVTVCEDRALGIPKMLGHNPQIDLVILDDAFQHRYVTPKVSIVLSSYNRPFFKDFIMPVGRLREIRKNIDRADILIYTKAPVGDRNYKTYDKPTFYSSENFGELRQVFGTSTALTTALVVSGIAHNHRFSDAMQDKLVRTKVKQYPDHHRYSSKEVTALVEESVDLNSTIVTTAKDWVKLKEFVPVFQSETKVYVQEVGVYMEHEDRFFKELNDKFDGKG